MAIFFRNRTEVFPAQARGNCQIRLHLVTVLQESTVETLTRILAEIGKTASLGIERCGLLDRRIIHQVPHVVEVISWTGVPGCGVEEENACHLYTHLERVAVK